MTAVNTLESLPNSSFGSGIRSIIEDSEVNIFREDMERANESDKGSEAGSNLYREVRLSTNETLVSRSVKKSSISKKVPAETCQCTVI